MKTSPSISSNDCDNFETYPHVLPAIPLKALIKHSMEFFNTFAYTVQCVLFVRCVVHVYFFVTVF